MKPFDQVEVQEALRERLDDYVRRVEVFRKGGDLDPVALAKLEEHFKASHVYHSAGIEGNRLTMQETMLVLREGIDVSDRRLGDTIEVANLGRAFDFLTTIADAKQTIRESDIRHLHELLIGDRPEVKPGAYRTTGVIISGSEHRPPEPLAIPALMSDLVHWINESGSANPVVVAAIAHHELAAIHPFLDGNGRVSRLLMNLILLRSGLPIANITREERPAYYEALSYADVGLPENLIEMILNRSAQLFSEFERIRDETRRMAEWAARWGEKEATVLLRKESREFELWQSRARQVLLEFQKASETLDEELEGIAVEFYDYQFEMTLERYGKLKQTGSIDRASAFAVSFTDRGTGRYDRFPFRYFRDWRKWPPGSTVIPIELGHWNPEKKTTFNVDRTGWRNLVRLRSIHFEEDGQLVIRYVNPGTQQECDERGKTIQHAVQWFFDDVLRNGLGLV
jgi:Fic family protein